MDRLARSADAALEVAATLFRPGLSRAANATALGAMEDALIAELGVSRIAAVRALTEALVRRTKAA
jgi:hypothetical protein